MADRARKADVAAIEREVADEVAGEFLAEGHSPHSLEARAEQAKRIKLRTRAQGVLDRGRDALGPSTRIFHVARRVIVGTYTDGFIHAGNLAYLALIALFPFFILLAAALSLFGGSAGGEAAIETIFSLMPPTVARALAGPIREVMTARTGIFLWLGALVALWTVGSLVETIRDILRRAYGTKSTKAFWQYRLSAIGITLASVFAVMFAFSMQVVITGIDQFLHQILPWADDAIALVASAKLVPMAILCVAMWSLFVALTPSLYKDRRFPKWPGAVATSLWWYGTTLLLPPTLSLLGGYGRTYGSLAGVMITLIFFFLVGLGVVIGAELNAALAEFPEEDDQPTAQNKGNGIRL